MDWDTAAGQAIEAAGGHVETLAGAPLAYGKPGFKNDGCLAWGRVCLDRPSLIDGKKLRKPRSRARHGRHLRQ